ncbi:unnamed protein product [Rhizoctonia solani]|uniref:Uncharacterized protein n=1 Tax=Rhizoctonia solani TaxID=456999 RepID=A0A8H3GY56_9AGAM|nr:unnamed protein product [Rhizoctonia solani]
MTSNQGVPTCRWTPAKVYQPYDGFSSSSLPHDWLYSVEELMSMQLDYVRELSSSVAGENVRDELMTVPAYFTQLQRQAINGETEVSGMRIVTFFNDGTAIAVNYTMARQLPSREVHMIHDSSAAATRTNHCPRHQYIHETRKHHPTTSLHPGFNTLGSETGFTQLIQTLPEAKVATDLKSEFIDRPYAKLAREAERIKAISSVDTEVHAGVEGLVGDGDFKTKLEQKARPRTCPGGSSRTLWVELASVLELYPPRWEPLVPFVQTMVKNAIESARLATKVDADEACVLGTAFYSASLCPLFNTKLVEVQDAVVCADQPAQFKYSHAVIYDHGKHEPLTPMAEFAEKEIKAVESLMSKARPT